MKFSKKQSLVASLGLAGMLALGATGAVMAQSSTPPATDPGSPTAPYDAHPGGGRFHGGPRGGLGAIIHASGLAPTVFIEGGQAGKTVATILTENGLVPADVVSTALSNLEEKLAQAVANGRITQEQADARLAEAEARLNETLETVPEPREPRHRPVVQAARRLVETAAEALGITPAELIGELRAGGKTIADVANEKGVNPQTIIDAAIAEANARIDEAVANGRITAEQGARLKEEAADRIPVIVNEGGPLRGPRGEGHPHGPRGIGGWRGQPPAGGPAPAGPAS
jgi:ribosomal protein S20